MFLNLEEKKILNRKKIIKVKINKINKIKNQ